MSTGLFINSVNHILEVVTGVLSKHPFSCKKKDHLCQRSDTNRAVKSQKMARGWKFWIVEVYYLCSENKGADQLCSYCKADLRLCFRICTMLVFSCPGSLVCLLFFFIF